MYVRKREIRVEKKGKPVKKHRKPEAKRKLSKTDTDTGNRKKRYLKNGK